MNTYNLKIYKFANICWQSFKIIVCQIKCSQSLCNKENYSQFYLSVKCAVQGEHSCDTELQPVLTRLYGTTC